MTAKITEPSDEAPRAGASETSGADRAELEGLVRAAGDAVQRRIGRDLHDGVSQLLVFAALSAKRLVEQAPEGLRAELARLVDTLNDAADRVQKIARGLSPIGLDQRSLTEALGSVGRSSGTRLTLAIDPLAELEPDAVKAELCLIAEEAIGNAVRHGRAGQVEVELRAGRGNLTLAIRDDGVGFDGARSLGIGIESMRARARSLGGSLEVATAEGGGTVVRCVWPAAARPPRLTP